MMSDDYLLLLRDECTTDGVLDAIAYGRAIEARLLNTPELADFARGMVLEALHQRGRWGADHDGGKDPSDWLWLVAHLTTRALEHDKTARRLERLRAGHPSSAPWLDGELEHHREKRLHHLTTAAAALANWHAQTLGLTNMRPGMDPAKVEGAKGG